MKLSGSVIKLSSSIIELSRLPQKLRIMEQQRPSFMSPRQTRSRHCLLWQDLEIDPGYSTPRNNRGVVFYKQKKYAEAIGRLDELLLFIPNTSNPEQQLCGPGQGWNYLEAIEYYDRPRTKPDGARVWSNEVAVLGCSGIYTMRQSCASKRRSISIPRTLAWNRGDAWTA